MRIQRTTILGEHFQALIPVLTDDGILRGLVQIPAMQLNSETKTITLGTRTLPLTALEFSDERHVRKLMCIVFPFSPAVGYAPWNGLEGWIPPSKLGNMAAWAIPVLNPGYQRKTLGLLNIFVSSLLDPKSIESLNTQTVSGNDSKSILALSMTLNVNADRFDDRFSFIELNWMDALREKLKALDIDEQCFLSIYTLDAPAPFHVVCYNSTSSSAVPYMLQIMRVGRQSLTEKSYQFVFEIEGRLKYHLVLTMNLK